MDSQNPEFIRVAARADVPLGGTKAVQLDDKRSVALFNVAALDILRGSHSTLTMEVRRYTKARLRARLARAGFEVDRMTYTNFTPFVPALALRGVERLTGRAGEASDHDLQVPSAPINGLFDLALSLEASWLRIVDLPIGTSIMAVARRRS